jgi:hypothetical protein
VEGDRYDSDMVLFGNVKAARVSTQQAKLNVPSYLAKRKKIRRDFGLNGTYFFVFCLKLYLCINYDALRIFALL